jgi:hypothetical protein
MTPNKDSISNSGMVEPDGSAAHSSDSRPSVSTNRQSEIPRWLPPAAFMVGVAFVLLIAFLIVEIPNPTESQFIIFRTVIALGGAAFSMALTGFLTIRFHWGRGGLIMAGGALAVFIVLYFASPAVPAFPKLQPLVDSVGHLLRSPANKSEMEVIRIQDEIMDLRQYKESVGYPDSRRKLKDAQYLAERILSFSDADLNPRRRYIKYEYAAFAYVDAAAAAMFDDPSRVEVYTSQVFKNVSTALSMLDKAERSYQTDENSRFLLDWVVADNGKDRVLYLRADAECMLGSVKNDSSLKARASETWNLISPNYRASLPATRNPQLSACIAK